MSAWYGSAADLILVLIILIFLFLEIYAHVSFDIISTTCVDGAAFDSIKILQGICSTVIYI